MAGDRDHLLEELFGAEAVPASLSGRLLRTREVAQLFQVSERTVAEWARRGRLPAVRTLGGHRLYPADQVRELLLSLQGEGAPLGDGRPAETAASTASEPRP